MSDDYRHPLPEHLKQPVKLTLKCATCQRMRKHVCKLLDCEPRWKRTNTPVETTCLTCEMRVVQ